MTFTEPQPKVEHVAASVRVPGMPGISYAIRIDNPYRPGAETGEGTLERTWATDADGLRSLARERLATGLADDFGITVSPKELEPLVKFLEYDERLFPVIPQYESLFGLTTAH
jgi:hypothetical protein